MGGGSWSSHDWDSFRSSATVDPTTGRSKTTQQIFSNKSINKNFDPKNIKVRESVDSPDNPNSTPIIVALDVTGSMGHIPDALIRDGLSTMATEILTRKPVSDPHIMFMAVGDAYTDSAPLQATQFEADIRIAEQLKELYLEGGGGGNGSESYHLPWYLAARKTAIDSFDKRGKKGFLFTMGDDAAPEELLKRHVKDVFGDDLEANIPIKDLLRMVEERYEVFHLMIQEGSTHDKRVENCWKDILGERALPVSDYTKIPEIIVSTLEVIGGKPVPEVVASWSGSTALAVRDSIGALTATGRTGGAVANDPTPTVWRPTKPGLGS